MSATYEITISKKKEPGCGQGCGCVVMIFLVLIIWGMAANMAKKDEKNEPIRETVNRVESKNEPATELSSEHSDSSEPDSALTTEVTLVPDPIEKPEIESGIRTWTDKQTGRTIEGEFIKYTNGVTHVCRADGKIVKIPLRNLSDDDKEYVRANK